MVKEVRGGWSMLRSDKTDWCAKSWRCVGVEEEKKRRKERGRQFLICSLTTRTSSLLTPSDITAEGRGEASL
jgi:hypothetical protein